MKESIDGDLKIAEFAIFLIIELLMTTSRDMRKWMARLDSGHQIGLETMVKGNFYCWCSGADINNQ